MYKRTIAIVSAILLTIAFLALAFSSTTPVAVGKVDAAISLNSTYTQTFDSLAITGTANPWADDSTLAGWYAARGSGGPLITTYRADAGISNSGALYSYGITNTTERALGSLSSGTPITLYYGLRMQNDTNVNVTGFVITYTGEQWRQGGNTAQQKLAFAYQVGSVVTNTMAGTWTDVNQLDFISPITNSVAITGPLDGNAAANRVTLSAQLNITVPVNQEIMFRWMDINDIGNDHGLAVDDLTIVAIKEVLSPEADLDVAKSGPATASAGDPITYTINLSNTGNVTATSTIVTDTLPVEVSFVTYTTSLPGSFSQPDAQTLVWNLGDVPGGASNLQIEVQGTISSGLSAGTLFTNTVASSTTYTETSLDNNAAQASTLIGAPDLIVVKDGPVSVNAGDPVAYTLTYSNAGNLPATGVVLVDQLPAAMSYVTDSLGTGVQVGNTITWTLGNLAVSASGSVVLTATTSTAGDQVNLATISSASPDGNPLNNVAIFTTTVLGGDPFVTKTGPAIVFGGELITYTIAYGNRGNVAADVTLTDTLPISFTTSDVAFDNSGLNPIDGTNTRAWTATLAAGDRFTFTLALTVPTEIANNTRITNTLDIATEAAGNVATNDRATASSTVYQIVPIAQARAGTNGQVFGIEGSVIYVPGTLGTNEWGMQDTSGGISMFYTPVPVAALGHRMRVVATRGAFGGAPQLGSPVYYSANRGSGPQVTPRPYTTGQVASGSTEGWLVVITGTVSNLTACSTTANYQFNLDDGSGSTVIFVDKDTLVNVCALGVVNGDPLVVTGFSTQFNGVFEVKPRFPADVQRVYQVTFVYNDLEDVVAVGEDVQLRGDFTNWAVNPISLSHDAGYTVFSTTLILPTDVAQTYKYFVPAGGGSGYDWLNTNDRSIAPQDGVTVQTDYRNVVVGWAKLQWPPAITLTLGEATPNIYGRLYIQGVTNGVGAGRGLKPEVGYGTTANPVSWSWSTMEFNAKDGPNNDEYRGVFTPTASGVYSYATRYNGNWGVGNPNSLWTYASLNGIPFDPTQTGVLTVAAPQLSITKTVATAHPTVDLGEVVTYTFSLSNTGDGAATGVLITDVLPTAVTFGGFVQQSGAAYGSGAITWSGSLNGGASATIIFTATVKNDRSLHGTNVSNTVQFTSGNDGSGNATTTFAIVNRYFTYLPFIKR